MRFIPAVALGRLIRFAVRIVRKGGGSALPGLVLSKVAPGLLAKTLKSFPLGVVVITGSAGKSTTTKMVVAIARAHGIEVFTNPTTANIEQGFFSSIIQFSNFRGVIPGDLAILEMDEGHAASICQKVSPRQTTILNVLEDQLDRFVDPSLVREKLLSVAKATKGIVVLNRDDQNTVLIGSKLDGKTSWFGLDFAADLEYAPTYLDPLPEPSATTRVFDLTGQLASIDISGHTHQVRLPNRGAHYALDAAAALETSRILLGERFKPSLAVDTLNELPPVFARGEIATIDGRQVEFILIQNPASTQLNLDALGGPRERLLFAIGRDVHDPSWLWTVTPNNLQQVDVVTGYNFAEAQLWLHLNGIDAALNTADLEEAWNYWMSLPEPTEGIRTVIFSADAMRRLRRFLGLTDPEAVKR
ncbi:MAG: Mur ligase family protein [Micrococcales bacterium]